MCRALSRACDRETLKRGTRLWGGSAGWAPGPRCASVDRAPIAKPWPTCWLLRKQGPTGCVKKNEPSQGVTTAGKSSHRDSCEDHACELAPRASHSNMVRPTFLPPPHPPPTSSRPALHHTTPHYTTLHTAQYPSFLWLSIKQRFIVQRAAVTKAAARFLLHLQPKGHSGMHKIRSEDQIKKITSAIDPASTAPWHRK